METGLSHDCYVSGLGRMELVFDLHFKDRIFEQALMNSAVLAIVTYLFGETCVLAAFPRTVPGLRVGILSCFNRWYMVDRSRHSELVTPEMLDRGTERFAALMGPKTMNAAADFVTRSNIFA